MLAAIAEAKREVLLEMYWIQGDKAGLMFRDALAAKAKQGAAVRVTYDAVGSIGAPASMWQPLIEAGGEVIEFAPVSPLRKRVSAQIASTFATTERFSVVDGETAFTGGMNIGDPWLPPEEGGGNWRDDAIQVTGPVAADLRALFFETWRRTGHDIPHDAGRFGRKVSGRVVAMTNSHGRQRGIRHAYLTGHPPRDAANRHHQPLFLAGPHLPRRTEGRPEPRRRSAHLGARD